MKTYGNNIMAVHKALISMNIDNYEVQIMNNTVIIKLLSAYTSEYHDKVVNNLRELACVDDLELHKINDYYRKSDRIVHLAIVRFKEEK